MAVKKSENMPYRPGVGMMVVNKDKEVFVARRIDTRSEAWQMPQGGIDKNETPEEAAIRELKEEIGTDKVDIVAGTSEWFYYDLPTRLAGKLWGGKYRGQKQKWFLMQFCGKDSDINIETKHPEFCAWKWVNANKIVKLIVPFKRKLYAQVIEEFSSYLKD